MKGVQLWGQDANVLCGQKVAYYLKKFNMKALHVIAFVLVVVGA